MTTLPSTAAREDLASARRSFRRLPLIAALALAFASLALISGIAYIVVLSGATGTAERLLVDRAAGAIDRQVARVRGRLDPVAEQLELIADLAAAGRIDVDSPVAVREALAVMMQRVPTVMINERALTFQKCQGGLPSPGGGGLALAQVAKVQVYVDGRKTSASDGESALEVLQDIPPSTVQIMEVYNGSSRIPGEYSTDACAVILIWTKSY